MTTLKTVKFDPGWGKHVLVYSGSVEYLYKDINKFKNLSQRSFKFKQYYPKILQLLDNNIGFYTGCILWGIYLKTLPGLDITGNHCLGQTYDEKTPDLEADYILTSIDNLVRDYKYYTGNTTTIPEIYKSIIIKYNEFATLNKGFTDTKTTDDILLPSGLKIPPFAELDEIKSEIDSVVETGELSKMIKHADKIL